MQRSSVASVGRLLSSVVSAVLLGVWINVFTNNQERLTYLEALRKLKYGNLLLLGSVVIVVADELLVRRLRKLELDDLATSLGLLRHRERRMLQNTLNLVCALISKTLRVPCNARYFVAVKDSQESIYLQQDRDLAVLNIAMPREYGFTRIEINTPKIVCARAYRERIPLFEELPPDHSDWYSEEVGRMIEPAQRWVLACPVLSLDPLTNRHNDDQPPHGVIVFYGTQLPPVSGSRSKIDDSLVYSQEFADYMSNTLNMLDIMRIMEKQSAPS